MRKKVMMCLDCPIEVYEWRTTKTAVAESAGLIKVLLENIYNDTGVVSWQSFILKDVAHGRRRN